MSNKKKLLVIQPYLTKYRIPVFSELMSDYKVLIGASLQKSYGNITNKELNGIQFFELKELSFFSGKILYQKGIIQLFLKEKPDLLFITANPRYLSFWLLIIISKFKRIKVILHGQGMYNKATPSIANKFTYYLFYLFSDKYVCYTESCKNSLKKLSIYRKSFVAENSIKNENPVQNQDLHNNGILYIGRLRSGCNIEMLIDVVITLNNEGGDLILNIIGGGDDFDFYKNKFANNPEIKFFGEVFDSKAISDISKSCFAGCYPGDAGLSILHYMSLSLVPIAHSSMTQHMGPEPSYIVNGNNGLLFERNSKESLLSTIKSLNGDLNLIKSLQAECYKTYDNLTTPSLGKRILSILNSVFKD